MAALIAPIGHERLVTGTQLDEASSCLDTAPVRSLFYLNNDGSICSPSMLRIGVEVRYVAIFSLAMLSFATAQLVFGPLGIVGVTMIGMLALQRRWLVWQLRTAESHLAASDYDAADECTNAVLGLPTAPADMRSCACQIAGQTAWARGNLVNASELFIRARELDDNHRRHKLRLELLDHAEIAVMVNLGRVRAARALVSWKSDDTAGAYLQLQRQTTELYLGFAIDHHELDSDELHDLAREALAAAPFPVLLLLVAWAFERTGDFEMTRMLLEHSESRWDDELGRAHPRLHSWLRARTRRRTPLALPQACAA